MLDFADHFFNRLCGPWRDIKYQSTAKIGDVIVGSGGCDRHAATAQEGSVI